MTVAAPAPAAVPEAGFPGLGDDRCWLRIAAGAERFDERIVRLDAPADMPIAERWLERWCRHFADGDRAALERRLSWDGWTPDLAARALAGPVAGAAAGRWLDWLRGHLARPFALDAGPEEGNAPAAPLWQAWALRAFDNVGIDGAPQAGCAALADALAQRLGALAGDVLLHDAAAHAAQAATVDSEHARDWLRRLAAGPALLALFERYPRLARQLAEASMAAVAAAAQAWRRIVGDRHRLGARFGAPFAGAPMSLHPVGADLHRDGQQVLRLCFADGRALYYKPRPLAAEATVQQLFRSLRTQGLDDAPPALAMLDCGDYGYVEAARYAGLPSPAARRRFVRRAGALVALGWLLNARDLHQDNLIASDDGPVAVDLEAVLQPEWPALAGTFAEARARYEGSCLASGLIGFTQAGADGVPVDASGLRGVAGRRQRRWQQVGPLAWRRVEVDGDEPARHRLHDGTDTLDPADHADALVAGFRTTLAHVLAHRDDWFAADGWLARFASVSVRVVFRPSGLYAGLQALLATPALQQDGAAAIVAIERLNRPFNALSGRPAWWPLVADERRQLEAGDIPLFALRADALGFDGTPALFARSGVDVLRARLEGLSASRIAEQEAQLRDALVRRPGVVAIPPRRAEPLSEDDCRDALARIVETVLEQAVRAGDGMIAWPSPASALPGARGHGGDHYLYRGSLGIAWFLAAARRTGVADRRAGDAVDAVIATLSRIADDPRRDRLLAGEDPGAGEGLGAVLLGLVALDALGIAGAGDLAVRFGQALPRACLQGAALAELQAGVAGSLLAFTALERRASAPLWRSRAVDCVARIEQLAADGLPPGWSGAPQSGFAHGLSGIAFALAQAADAFDVPAWRVAAERLLDAEDRAFDAASGNWRPCLDRDDAAGINAWCNGATGIVLARAAAGLWRGRPSEETALARLAGALLAPVDHLCCGLAGRAESLRLVAQALDRPLLAAALPGWRAALVHDGLPQLDAGSRAPGLWRGVSGVGMALLTGLAAELPSPLLYGMPMLARGRLP